MDDLSRFCCQNRRCADYGRRGAGNLTACMEFGRKTRWKLLYCRTCKERFSERKGTVFFRSRLPREKVIAVVEHIGEGCGVRKTSRLTGVKRDTVSRYSKLAGEHAKALHEEPAAPERQRGKLVGFSP